MDSRPWYKKVFNPLKRSVTLDEAVEFPRNPAANTLLPREDLAVELGLEKVSCVWLQDENGEPMMLYLCDGRYARLYPLSNETYKTFLDREIRVLKSLALETP